MKAHLTNRKRSLLLLAPWLATACATSSSTHDTQPSASVAAATSTASSTAEDAPSDIVAASTNDFGFDLYPKLAAEPHQNLAYSPTSIAIALAMTAAGARGPTEQAMHRVLHFPPQAERLHSAWGHAMARWRGLPDVEIRVANRLFGQSGAPFEAAFLTLNAERYDAPLLPVDFVGAPEVQRKLINDWVADRTKQRIVDLIPPGGVDGSTNLVLANAIYLKTSWASPFDALQTGHSPFTTSKGDVLDVLTMHQVSEVPHAVVDGAVVARLDHRGGAFATTFVMPEQGHSLASIERALSRGALERWSAALTPTRVHLSLPAVKIEPGAPVELSAPLKALGMEAAFDGADFSGISPRSLTIDEIYHKAFVAMNEDGTEAAAATAVSVDDSAALPLPEAPPLAFDRPFLFFIRDTQTGLVLFVGRMSQPA